MSSASFDMSVIVATHQRRTLVFETLEALAEQDVPDGCFEVIVSADSCTDGTAEAIRDSADRWPMPVRVVEHSGANASTTRNTGARAAVGDWLVFIDDDIRPLPGFLAAHLAARREGSVNLGYSKPRATLDDDRYHREAWGWWEDTFVRVLGEDGHRFTYMDFLSGNFGLSAALFAELDGFDETFTLAWEDHEFGLRLIEREVRLAYLPEAVGSHAYGTDLAAALARRRQEGKAAVRFGRAHPQLRYSLFAGFVSGGMGRRLRLIVRIAESRGRGERIATALGRFGGSPRTSWRHRRSVASGIARDLRYWQGVLDEIGSAKALSSWLQDAPLPPTITPATPSIEMGRLLALDPDTPVDDVVKGADKLGVRVLYSGMQLLGFAADPGAERLRVFHVAAAAQRLLHERFFEGDPKARGVLATSPACPERKESVA